jgi:hypothetical protein
LPDFYDGDRIKTDRRILAGQKKEEEMGKILIKGAVKREKGCMYYIDGAGNVCEAKMARGGSKKKKKAVKKAAPKKKGRK